MFRLTIFVSLLKYDYYSLIKCMWVLFNRLPIWVYPECNRMVMKISRARFRFQTKQNKAKQHVPQQLGSYIMYGKYLAIKLLLYCFNWRQMFTRAYNVACASICSCSIRIQWVSKNSELNTPFLVWQFFSSTMNRSEISGFFPSSCAKCRSNTCQMLWFWSISKNRFDSDTNWHNFMGVLDKSNANCTNSLNIDVHAMFAPHTRYVLVICLKSWWPSMALLVFESIIRPVRMDHIGFRLKTMWPILNATNFNALTRTYLATYGCAFAAAFVHFCRHCCCRFFSLCLSIQPLWNWNFYYHKYHYRHRHGVSKCLSASVRVWLLMDEIKCNNIMLQCVCLPWFAVHVHCSQIIESPNFIMSDTACDGRAISVNCKKWMH